MRWRIAGLGWLLCLAACGGGGGAGAPETRLTAIPQDPFFEDATAVFEFRSPNDRNAVFEVVLDGETIDAASPLVLKDLTPGEHTVEVCAVAEDGTRDPTPVVHSWTVHPELQVVVEQRPDSLTVGRTASVSFAPSFEAASVRATLDGVDLGLVESPLVLDELADGYHVLSLQAEVADASIVSAPNLVEWNVTDGRGTLDVNFPPSVSVALTSRMTVRGVGGLLTRVSVNGIQADLDESTGAWSAVVDLEQGENSLVIAADDLAGERHVDVRRVDFRGHPFHAPFDVVFDEKNDRLLVTDGVPGKLIAVDPRTGEREVLRDWGTGPYEDTKTQWSRYKVKPLELDPDNNAVLALRPGGMLETIDLDTGAATTLIDGTESFQLEWPRAIALDRTTRELFIGDRFECTLHGFDVDTLERRVVRRTLAQR